MFCNKLYIIITVIICEHMYFRVHRLITRNNMLGVFNLHAKNLNCYNYKSEILLLSSDTNTRRVSVAWLYSEHRITTDNKGIKGSQVFFSIRVITPVRSGYSVFSSVIFYMYSSKMWVTCNIHIRSYIETLFDTLTQTKPYCVVYGSPAAQVFQNIPNCSILTAALLNNITCVIFPKNISIHAFTK